MSTDALPSTVANIPLLELTYDHIASLPTLEYDDEGRLVYPGEDGPLEQTGLAWYQRAYRRIDDRCGTGMCFAGWTAQLAGGQWLIEHAGDWEEYLVPEEGDHPDDIALIGAEDLGVGDEDISPGTAMVHVSDRARRLLGLDERAALDLFSASNTLADIRRVIDKIKDREAAR